MGPFLIIFGTRGVTYSSGNGDFYCPDCQSTRQYGKKRVRRFFTLYFIPLIPLDLRGEYVECDQCRSTYDPAVLSLDLAADDSSFDAQYQHAIKRVMVLMCLADGVVDDDEVATIASVYGELAGRAMSEAEVREEIKKAAGDRKEVEDYVKEVVGSLNQPGKELVVRSAFLVAAADGEFQDEERELLTRIGKALEMSPKDFKVLLDSMMAAD